MKRVFRIIGCTVIFIIICIAAFFAYRIFLSVTSIDEIEGQELIKTEVSPGGIYEAKAYLNNGGATVDYAVLVVLVWTRSQTRKKIFTGIIIVKRQICDGFQMKKLRLMVLF